MKFDFKNIHELIIGWSRKDAQLHEALKRLNSFCLELNKFLNDPVFEKIGIGTATFTSDRNQLSQASAMTQTCRIYNSVAFLVDSLTLTNIELNSQYWDTDGMQEDTLYSRITFQTAGFYEVGANVAFEPFVGGYGKAYIILNGSIVIAVQTGAPDPAKTNETEINVSTIYKFAQGDYIGLYIWHNEGSPISILRRPNYSPELWAHRLS